ncbi:LysE family translocator [Pseudoalteromonas spongiae]|uniref:LysE family translocator n=1 Tax=Pseudoalteromonas spongiae TaxID=298657 RepID=A0ABU8EV86_9GAMM
MDFALWISLVGVCAIGAMSPGPSLAVVLSHSMTRGLKQGLIASVAHGVGVGIYATLAVVGLAGFIHEFPIAYKVVLFAGAAYLVYLAVNILRQKTNHFEITNNANTGNFTAAQDGFAIAFLNPKLAIFFLALFSQFIDPDSITIGSAAIMCITVLVIDTLWYCLVSLITSHANQKFELLRYGKTINNMLAIAFILLAIRVVVTNI